MVQFLNSETYHILISFGARVARPGAASLNYRIVSIIDVSIQKYEENM